MGKGNHASNIRKIGKSYETDLTKPNIEGGKCVAERQRPGLKGDFSGSDRISSPKKLTGKNQIGFR